MLAALGLARAAACDDAGSGGGAASDDGGGGAASAAPAAAAARQRPRAPVVLYVSREDAAYRRVADEPALVALLGAWCRNHSHRRVARGVAPRALLGEEA